jgi:type IV pilus assembly protein PilP
MKRLLISLSASALLTGCGANIDDLIAYTESVRANTKVSIEPYPEFAPLPNVSYTASDHRSPFLRSRTEQVVQSVKDRPNCQQPNNDRRKQALESYGIDSLEMAGVFTNNGRQYALIKAFDGSLHKVTRGNYIGLFNGRVSSIHDSEILIQEMLPDGAGCWKSKQTTLTKPSMVGGNSNV